jgi:hypothetical protein
MLTGNIDAPPDGATWVKRMEHGCVTAFNQVTTLSPSRTDFPLSRHAPACRSLERSHFLPTGHERHNQKSLQPSLPFQHALGSAGAGRDVQGGTWLCLS